MDGSSIPSGVLDKQALLDAAIQAAANAYAPYSNFHVGAAVLCSDGTIVSGCNVENASYGLSCCAERTALFAAVNAAKKPFSAIAVYSPDSDVYVSPCGACRQVIAELAPDAVVIMADCRGNYTEAMAQDLLPGAFILPDSRS